ncbi:MAG: ABC transporter permease [Candidimonas sp.]|nr:ABC transporter permease [Candidimonas sp.]
MKPSTRLLRLLPVVLFAAVVGTWEMVAQLKLINPILLPSASAVFLELIKLLGLATTWKAIGVTALEVFASFFIAVPAGVLIGLFLAESKYWGAVFKPLFYFLFSIPKSIFLPMFILALGIGVGQKIAFGVFSTIFIVLMSITAAVESVSGKHRLVAQCYGATKRQIAVHVYLPSMLPAILETLRLAMIFNFTGIILAEMYVSRAGIGNLLERWGQNYMLPQLLAGVVIVSCAAILFNESLRALENKFGHWRSTE